MPKHSANKPEGNYDQAFLKGGQDRSNDIGLTQAFSPIGDDGWPEGAHAYPDEEREVAFDEGAFADENPGSTDRFAPIADEKGSTDGFAPIPDASDGAREQGMQPDGEDVPVDVPAAKGAQEEKPHVGAHAAGFSYKGDADDEYPDALESLEPVVEPSMLDPGVPESASAPSRGRHSSGDKEEIPSYMRKSRRMRRILIVVVVLLVLLLVAGGYFAVRLFQTAQTAAYQQTQQQQSNQDTSSLQAGSEGNDATSTVKKTSAPNLVDLLGCTQDEALAKVGRGAQVTVTSEVNEEGNPIKTEVRVALTDEPADTRTGTPTVYLGLNEDGAVVQAGYSAGTASLGYGTLSFSDAVKNESIIEKTLQEAGIAVPTGTVSLPADKTQYSTYASDGTTLVKEYCPFSGDIDISGTSHTWSAVLSYDYSVANASGNLADTIRIIYVYINA